MSIEAVSTPGPVMAAGPMRLFHSQGGSFDVTRCRYRSIRSGDLPLEEEYRCGLLHSRRQYRRCADDVRVKFGAEAPYSALCYKRVRAADFSEAGCGVAVASLETPQTILAPLIAMLTPCAAAITNIQDCTLIIEVLDRACTEADT